MTKYIARFLSRKQDQGDYISRFLSKTSDKKDAVLAFSELDKKSRKFTDDDFFAALHPENKHKNRYTNILAPDHSLVTVGESNDYLNANLLDFRIEEGNHARFIVGQYPLPETFADFWTMVLEQKIRLIVALSPLEERRSRKGDRYWPEDSQSYGGVNVTLVKEEIVAPNVTLRTMDVAGYGTVTQIEFVGWKDFGVCPPAEMLAFMRLYRSLLGPDPPFVHCSAGVGRTGVFCVLDTVMRSCATFEDDDVDLVERVLLQFRDARPGLVQTPEQLRFIYECLDMYLKSKN